MDGGHKHINGTTLCLQTNPTSTCNITMFRFEFGDTVIEFLPWPTCSTYLSPIENMWPMLAHRLVLDTPPAATPDQLRQYVETTWGDCCTPRIHPKPL
ncbi:hypothetical protein TNCV_4968071 [Trichonephila clavipes]|nr:hypothetical protein TNCV_4968071 [Trichonephila clavipes]